MTADTLIFAQSMFHKHFLQFFFQKPKEEKNKVLVQKAIRRHSLNHRSLFLRAFCAKPQTPRAAAFRDQNKRRRSAKLLLNAWGGNIVFLWISQVISMIS